VILFILDILIVMDKFLFIVTLALCFEFCICQTIGIKDDYKDVVDQW
jgi:hypothetical protein